ncbi:hypothetical protein [Leifsonia sp. LS-T14]|uniref:hypothetical protein n=1 Tax=unclassified Leifsonia TaxID=2663824 RepID=UPI0035A6EAC7
MRIRDGSTKAILVIAGYAFALLIGTTVGLSTQPGWGVATSSGIVLALVLVLCRLFRGANETDARRTWWRMTAGPPAAYVLACWFGVNAIASVTSTIARDDPVGWVGAVISLSLAALYLNSAIGLTGPGSPASRPGRSAA